jgi:hypothetical protein
MRGFAACLLAAALGAAACYEAPSTVATPSLAPDAGLDGAAPTVPRDDDPRTLRLTRDEYDRTVRDLFGLSLDGARPSDGLPEDDRVEGLPFGTAVTALHVEKERAAAERIATQVLEIVAFLCVSIDDDRKCGETVIESLAPRAFRRPLDRSHVEVSLYPAKRTHP